jgi:hypothetical protein
MSPQQTSATPFTLTLTEVERNLLLNWLEERLRETRVEEHRTDALGFKQRVRREEDVIGNVINKLRQD